MKHSFYRKYGKRVIDLILAVPALLLLLPVLLAVAVLVRIRLGSPVLFCQERPGYREQIFKMWKFRTMTDARDADGRLLPDEARLTELGAFLRKTSLDELPELFNIICGDMTIIGPRPLLVRYLPLYSKEQHRRHEAVPGLVGLAALSGRNNQSWDSKFKCDLEYVDNISLRMDLKIFLGAIGVVLKREGVSQEGHATMEDFEGYVRRKQCEGTCDSAACR